MVISLAKVRHSSARCRSFRAWAACSAAVRAVIQVRFCDEVDVALGDVVGDLTLAAFARSNDARLQLAAWILVCDSPHTQDDQYANRNVIRNFHGIASLR